MLRNAWRPAGASALLWAALLVSGPGAAMGQAAPGVQLRYHPRVGSLMHTRSDLDVTMTFVGLPAIPDSETAIMSTRLSLAQRVLRQDGPNYRVRVTLDSARANSRVANGLRKEVPFRYDGTSIESMLDSVMTSTPADTARLTTRADTAARAFVRAIEPLFKMPLPSQPVAAGSQWIVTQALPMGDFAVSGVPGSPPGPRTMTVRITAKVDSLVARGADTLAYVSYGGNYEPVTVSIPDSAGNVGTMVVRGGMAASQIWSTSWSGWVAAGMRSRVEMKLRGPGPSGTTIDATITVEMTGRMAVHL